MGCLVGGDTEGNESEYQFSKPDECKYASYMDMHYINDTLYPIYDAYTYHNDDIIEAKMDEASV